ncbi:hypothetical protein MJH12_00590 [bacterium]|nr:hypothetical protein [bacterium]
MMKTFLFLTLSAFLYASGSHHEMGKEPEHPKVYNDYKLTKKATKGATAVYLDTCGNQIWKQDASKKKACPYCGPGMPNCGKLIKVIAKRGVEYSWNEYDLPNKICPVTGEILEDHENSIVVDGHRIFVCCKNCIKKFKKVMKKGKTHRYLRRLPLKPELFGFTKTKSKKMGQKVKKKIKKSSHDHSAHDHGSHQH